MKKILFTLTLAFSLISFSSFATDGGNVSSAALQSFSNAFKNASEVNWSVSERYSKADFALNGQYVSAFYENDGKLIALTRNISTPQLPLALQASLKKSYEDYWVSDLFEVANDEGTSYYITIENADTKLVLKAGSGSDWSNFRKQRKA